MHGAVDSLKCNSAPAFPKKLCVSRPYHRSPDPLPPPQIRASPPTRQTPLVVANPLAASCNCLGVRRGFRMGCAPGTARGGGGGAAAWLSSTVEEKVDELLWREENQSLLEGVEAAERHAHRHRAAGGHNAPRS
jgi:hypothetical protein